MKVLVTGADGFIAKNLIEHLKRDKSLELYLYSKKDSLNILEAYVKEVDFIFHLAGVNRPKNKEEFYEGNSSLTKIIVDILKKEEKNTPILLSSSTQSLLDNDYGKSKLEAENLLLNYAKECNSNIYIYLLPNVFGKWSRPNYNSVISTWCHNITHNIDITINDENHILNLVYIDDVIKSFVNKLKIKNTFANKYFEIDTVHSKTLGEIKSLLFKFKDNRKTLVIPDVASGFERALYATYLSYLDENDFSYELKGHKDERGTFFEVLKTLDSGQFSLSSTAPGVMRGNHYHHTKNEKFLVIKGEATIELKHIITNKIVSYKVSDKKMEVVEMIPGYTHNIKNTGDEEMLLFLWANESFDQDNPDTYFLEV
ncbi:MAG: capsular biosynthesis protein [Arcobacter sp.]|nr:MAG: capsular biosynthesis protein [Arcobacter sp.]PHR71961.1 MAG: capsular biosynthesis protein [Arcobacter sp.]